MTPVARRLVQPTRMIWPQNRLGPKPRVIPIWSCSRWGLPCGVHCWQPGALLPHPFTLTCLRPFGLRHGEPEGLSRRSCNAAKAGGLLSVALSLRSPSPAINRHRVSMEPGLSSSSRLPHCQRSPGQLAGAVVGERGKSVKRARRNAEGSPDLQSRDPSIDQGDRPTTVAGWLSRRRQWSATATRSSRRRATPP